MTLTKIKVVSTKHQLLHIHLETWEELLNDLMLFTIFKEPIKLSQHMCEAGWQLFRGKGQNKY